MRYAEGVSSAKGPRNQTVQSCQVATIRCMKCYLATGAIAIPRSVAGWPSIPTMLGAKAHSIALSPNPFREFRRLRSVIELAYADARKRFVERGSAEEFHAA